MIQGVSEAPQNISFAAMAERQQALAEVILAGSGGREPVVASSASTAPTRRSTAAAFRSTSSRSRSARSTPAT